MNVNIGLPNGNEKAEDLEKSYGGKLDWLWRCR
jgi:hypothetical protein